MLYKVPFMARLAMLIVTGVISNTVGKAPSSAEPVIGLMMVTVPVSMIKAGTAALTITEPGYFSKLTATP